MYRKIFTCSFLALAFAFTPAHAISTAAKFALLMDYDTGEILYNKSGYETLYPASMTKIMTAYLVFEQIKDGRLSLDDELSVSEKAWRKGGSKMFVEVGDEVNIEDLIKGVVIQSGNDASIVLAEGLSGTEEDFALEMTAKAEQLGMEKTVFKNATGWPDPEHITSAYDLAVLSRNLIQNFPEYYKYYSEIDFSYNGIKQGNRNPLLYKNIGADGIKTGHTDEAGYCLTASAIDGDRRLLLVLGGMESKTERSAESEKLLRWGFREFDNYTLFQAGDLVEVAETWLGKKTFLPLTLQENLVLTLPKRAVKKAKIDVLYDGPLQAPIRQGEEVASLRITLPGEAEPIQLPLVAAESVEKLSGLNKIKAVLDYLLWGGNPDDLPGRG